MIALYRFSQAHFSCKISFSDAFLIAVAFIHYISRLYRFGRAIVIILATLDYQGSFSRVMPRAILFSDVISFHFTLYHTYCLLISLFFALHDTADADDANFFLLPIHIEAIASLFADIYR